MKTFLSLGAGVQSSTLALMIAHKELPMVDAAIFADTHAEPKKVMDWLDWLEPLLPFPVYRVSQGNLNKDMVTMSVSKDGTEYLRNVVPAFTLNPDGSKGMLLRKCTSDYKLAPIRRKVRELSGGKSCEQWIGISIDEAIRQKPSGVNYITNRYPLIEKGMTRGHCLIWMREHGYPEPPKSSCIFCPYHSDEQWASLTPEELAKVAELEREWNKVARADQRATQTRGVMRFHRSMVPIDQANFYEKERRSQLDFFGNECEGMCGV